MTTHAPGPDLARLGGSSRWRALCWAATRFWSGDLLRRRAHRRAEGNLERAHDAHGSDSFEYRRAYRNAEAARFAAEFGAVDDEVVRRVVEIAVEGGASLDDLRVLVLNKSLFSTVDGRVHVRIAWWERWLASAPSIFGCGTWVILSLHTLRQHGPVWLKATVMAAISAVVAFLWCGWYLYYRGPWASANRSKSFIDRASSERLLQEPRPDANVVSLPRRSQ